jgi:hypothetical protein
MPSEWQREHTIPQKFTSSNWFTTSSLPKATPPGFNHGQALCATIAPNRTRSIIFKQQSQCNPISSRYPLDVEEALDAYFFDKSRAPITFWETFQYCIRQWVTNSAEGISMMMMAPADPRVPIFALDDIPATNSSQ